MEAPEKNTRPVLTRIFISQDERRLRAGWRLGLHGFLVMCMLILLGGVFSAGLSLVPNIKLTNTLLLIGSQAITLVAFTVSVVIARRFLDQRSFTSLGLGWNKHAFGDLSFGFLVPGLMMGLIYLIEWLAGWLTFQGFAWHFVSFSQIFIDLGLMFVVFIVVSWQEELLSRGYWLQNLSEGLNQFWGALISSVLFALLHLGNPHMSWYAGLGLFAAGMFMAYAYVRTRQLWLAFGLHAGWNFFEGPIFGFNVSGLEGLSAVIWQSVTGPESITGGAFGPEAGLVLLPALLLGVVLILWYTKNRVQLSSDHGI